MPARRMRPRPGAPVRSSGRRFVRPVAMAFLPVVAAAGCHPGNRPTAESTGFAGTAVEGTIEGALAAQLRHKDMTTGQAHCPAAVNPTTAKAAYCALDVEGQSARIKVTRRGAGFVVRTDQVIVNVAALEAQGERQLKQRYLLDCGVQAVRVLNVKGTLRCLATPHQGKPISYTVAFTTLDGNQFTLTPRPH